MHRENATHRIANIDRRPDCLVCASGNANPWWQGVGCGKGGGGLNEGGQLGASHAVQLMMPRMQSIIPMF